MADLIIIIWDILRYTVYRNILSYAHYVTILKLSRCLQSRNQDTVIDVQGNECRLPSVSRKRHLPTLYGHKPALQSITNSLFGVK